MALCILHHWYAWHNIAVHVVPLLCMLCTAVHVVPLLCVLCTAAHVVPLLPMYVVAGTHLRSDHAALLVAVHERASGQPQPLLLVPLHIQLIDCAYSRSCNCTVRQWRKSTRMQLSMPVACYYASCYYTTLLQHQGRKSPLPFSRLMNAVVL